MNIMLRVLVLALLFSKASFVSGQIILSKHGKTKYEIVTSPNATAAESHAAKELKSYLKKVTKADFRLIDEKNKNNNRPAIYIGNTKFAAQNHLSQSLFCPEEWRIKNIGKDIVITGGRPRGVLYGVYEFLEKFVGCRWYSINMDLVPSVFELQVPSHIDIRMKPAFKYRYMSFIIKKEQRKFNKYVSHLKFNGQYRGIAKYGFAESFGSPRDNHTYYAYSKGFPLEYYAMDKYGKRRKALKGTDGQICYSNPNVRRLFAKRLREYIKADRQRNKKIGAPNPVFYAVEPNDGSMLCHCKKCRALADKYGVSGMIIDFTNSIAKAIEKEFPNVLITVLAYKEGCKPPKNIRARKNVVVRLGSMDIEFNGNRDVFRPLNSSINQPYVKFLDAWSKVADELAIWDYWKLFYEQFPSPKTCISNRADYIKKYRDIGACHLFIQHSADVKMPDSFIDLRNYIGAKLMVSPDIDDKTVINDFINGFYGKGAAPMKKYFDYLEKRMIEEKQPLGSVQPSKRTFLDKKFFVYVDKLLSKAECLAAKQPMQLANIRQERLVVDLAYLNMFTNFPDNPLKLSKQKILKRVLTALDAFGGKYYKTSYWGKIRKKIFDNVVAQTMTRPPLPKAVQGKIVTDMIWTDFVVDRIISENTVVDKDAVGSKAFSVPLKRYSHKEPFHGRDVAFGIYSRSLKRHLLKKKLGKENLPQDEKYHYYYVGRTQLSDISVLWVHWTWYFTSYLKNVYDPNDSLAVYDVYISLKLQGPSYVKGSKKKDDFRIDRAIFVKVLNKNEKPVSPIDLDKSVQK